MNQQNIGRDHTARKSGGGFGSRITLTLLLFCAGLLLQGCSEGTLKVIKLGAGEGEIRTADFQYSCPAPSPTCEPKRVKGDPEAILVADEADDSFFGRWGLDGVNHEGNIFRLLMEGERKLYVTFYPRASPPPPTAKLTFRAEGRTTGLTQASPISTEGCGDRCNVYKGGTIVFLSAEPRGYARFERWEGCPHVDGLRCVVAMTQDITVIAHFTGEAPVRRDTPLFVSLDSKGTGKGEVEMESEGRKAACLWRDSPCTEYYARDAEVRLRATPAGDSVFDGWTGDCTGNDPNNCVVSMSGGKEVRARFTNEYPLTVVRVATSGSTFDGAVNARLADKVENIIDCGSGCPSQSYPLVVGTRVAINAIPNLGSRATFAGGCVSQVLNTCYVTMPKGGITITVTFGP